MKRFYTARELAGMPGLLSTKRNLTLLAQRKGWPVREQPARGGTRLEYPYKEASTDRCAACDGSHGAGGTELRSSNWTLQPGGLTA